MRLFGRLHLGPPLIVRDFFRDSFDRSKRGPAWTADHVLHRGGFDFIGRAEFARDNSRKIGREKPPADRGVIDAALGLRPSYLRVIFVEPAGLDHDVERAKKSSDACMIGAHSVAPDFRRCRISPSNSRDS